MGQVPDVPDLPSLAPAALGRSGTCPTGRPLTAGALIPADRVLHKRNPRRHSYALQIVPGHFVAFHQIAARDSGPLRAASQVDATPQQIVAGMRLIQIPKLVSQNLVWTADDEDPSILSAVDGVIRDSNFRRLHIRIAIVHDDAEVLLIGADVPGHISVMEAIQIDALSINV